MARKFEPQEARVEEALNDGFRILLVDERWDLIDTVPWPEARERVEATFSRAVDGEGALTAIFTGRAHGV